MSSSAHNARSQAVEDGQLPRQQESGHGQTAHDLSTSSLTIPSDSEPYSSLSPPSTSPPPHSIHNREERDSRSDREQSKTVLVYTRPTFWSLVRGAVINLLLPFVNGMMLGLGELLAHEIAFRWGWGTTQVGSPLATLSSISTCLLHLTLLSFSFSFLSSLFLFCGWQAVLHRKAPVQHIFLLTCF